MTLRRIRPHPGPRTPMLGQHQCGAVAVEAALALPMLIGVGLIGVDMQRIQTERLRLENAAAATALNLALQPELTKAGVDALAKVALQGHADTQQLIIMSVRQSGRVNWVLERGGRRDLCAVPAAGGRYSGTLPEAPPEAPPDAVNSDDDGSTFSLIVVRACRDTSDVALSGGLTIPRTLDTSSLLRSSSMDIGLDRDLQAESDASGLAYAGATS